MCHIAHICEAHRTDDFLEFALKFQEAANAGSPAKESRHPLDGGVCRVEPDTNPEA